MGELKGQAEMLALLYLHHRYLQRIIHPRHSFMINASCSAWEIFPLYNQLLITTFTYSNVFLFRAAGFVRNSTD